MIIDAKTIPSDSVQTADICIVGTGAAGIPLALALAESKKLKVLVIEAGYLHEDEKTQDLYTGEVVNQDLHSPADKYRQRRFGGSTAIWGGRCMPFEAIDFEKRDYVPGSGWPVTLDDLAPYYPAANKISEAGDYLYDADDVFDPQAQAMFKGFASPVVRTNSLERFSCPTNFAARYQNRLSVAENITVLLGANCTHIQLDPNTNAVTHLQIATLAGNKFQAKARHFVLATGGIETARLLLASNDVRKSGIGNENDLVGRNYMCHIAGNVGALTIHGPTSNVRHGYEISPEGIYCRRRLCLTETEQRRIGAGNMVARLHFPRIADPSHRNGVLSGLFMAKYFISYEYGKRLHDGNKTTLGTYAAHLRNIVTTPLDTVSFAYNWLTKRTLAERKFPSVILKNKTNKFSLEIHSEQFPNPNSRVTLSEQKDLFGKPKVKIDWRYQKEDIESVRKTLNVFSDEFQRSGVGRFEFDNETLENDLTRFGAYGGHHIGTTRMGDNPQESVVDKNCKLHSVENLYIASSSIFPTSSQANPTLTITAFALRLAHHLLNGNNHER